MASHLLILSEGFLGCYRGRFLHCSISHPEIFSSNVHMRSHPLIKQLIINDDVEHWGFSFGSQLYWKKGLAYYKLHVDCTLRIWTVHKAVVITNTAELCILCPHVSWCCMHFVITDQLLSWAIEPQILDWPNGGSTINMCTSPGLIPSPALQQQDWNHLNQLLLQIPLQKQLTHKPL